MALLKSKRAYSADEETYCVPECSGKALTQGDSICFAVSGENLGVLCMVQERQEVFLLCCAETGRARK